MEPLTIERQHNPKGARMLIVKTPSERRLCIGLI